MTMSVRVKATIIEDNSGIKSELPIILTSQGELSSVTDYLLKLEVEGRSVSTINRVVQATRLLIDYMEANKGCFADPKKLFQTFSKRLYTGTIGDDGLDPSGLYWVPPSTKTTNLLISALTGLTDYLALQQSDVPNMNPLRDATPHEQRINYAAWFRKNQNDFLGHIEDKGINRTTRKARTIKGRTPLIHDEGDGKAFPEALWNDFYRFGIGGAKDPRVALRDKLIALLMHGGGLRESEALSLWVMDVKECPYDSEVAIVRIYDETDGTAPDGWHNRYGGKTRKAYLKSVYSMVPRRSLLGTSRVGWKSRVADDKDNYLQVQWFPVEYGKLFKVLWLDYLKYRASIDAHHPFAFIAFHPSYQGSPYTLNAFNENYSSALRRIGLKPNKSLGQDPHGHRHSYGRRLEQAGVDPLVLRRCLHHKSLDSQIVYTTKSQEAISQALNEATANLNNPNSKVKPLDWKSMAGQGFEDIDPKGYFTGTTPYLGKKL